MILLCCWKKGEHNFSIFGHCHNVNKNAGRQLFSGSMSCMQMSCFIAISNNLTILTEIFIFIYCACFIATTNFHFPSLLLCETVAYYCCPSYYNRKLHGHDFTAFLASGMNEKNIEYNNDTRHKIGVISIKRHFNRNINFMLIVYKHTHIFGTCLLIFFFIVTWNMNIIYDCTCIYFVGRISNHIVVMINLFNVN
jgi:hypothetical protein